MRNMDKSNFYTEDSIKSLDPLQFTRLRPGVYVGSTEYSTQLLVEIVSNAVDEFRAGHGNTITVMITDDNWISVEDNGQGFIPNAKREDGKTILEASFSVLNTSGKYSEDGVYSGVALGLNGIGSKLPVYLSHHSDILSWRDGKYEQVWFEEGVLSDRDVGDWNNKDKPSGTLVRWQPSEEFFTDPHIDLKVIKKLLKVLVCLCPGLKINLNDEVFYSENGLSDLVDEAVKDKEILKNRFELHKKIDNKNVIDFVMTYTDSYNNTFVPYVNTGLTESGPHLTQIKTVLTRELNKFFREKGWLKEKDENLSGDDCQEGIYVAFNLTAPGISYDAQTKGKIVKIDMKPFTSILAEMLQNWLSKNEKEIKVVADKALKARKARVAAQKARESIRTPKGKGLKAKVELSDKLAECNGKNRDKCELWLLEGDSAIGSAKQARDPVTQSVMALRGKVLNTEKVEVDKMLGNKELATIISVLGTGYGDNFNVDKCRYGKIIFLTDADVDGSHIDLLLLTFFYRYMRELIESGKIYLTVPPLFRARKGNDYVYLKDEAELTEYRLSHTNFDLARFKGVGEMSADQLWETTMNPEVRTLKRMTIEDAEEANRIITKLMGKEVKYRKEFLSEFGDTVEIDV